MNEKLKSHFIPLVSEWKSYSLYLSESASLIDIPSVRKTIRRLTEHPYSPSPSCTLYTPVSERPPVLVVLPG